MRSATTPVSGTVSAAAERGGIGLYEWNPITQELLWDDTLARVFVADRAGELPFDTWLRRVHPEDQQRVIATFAEFKEAEETYRLVLDDGTIRYVLSRATQIVHDATGTPVKMIGVMIDVTTAHEAGARMTAMLESISDGFFSLDRSFRFIYTNPQAEVVLGMQREELIGRCLFDLFPDARGTRFESAYQQVMTQRVGVCFEEYYPAPLNMWFEVNAQPSAEGLVVYFQDITVRRAQEQERERLLAAERVARCDAEAVREQLAHQASHDSLTGLLNRSELAARAGARCAGANRTTVLFLDLDRFKLINDSRGHAVGDELLVEIAHRLVRTVRPDDLVARLGGDEFAVVLSGHDADSAEQIARRLLSAVHLPVDIGRRSITVTASIGLASADQPVPFDTLLRDADVALYRAKDGGRDRIAWFDALAHGELLQKVALEADLREALETGQIALHYQPVFDAGGLQAVGAEALARWWHPEHGQVSPSVFVPLAEEAGLADRLGDVVLAQACVQASRWTHLPNFRVWVNVSPRQMQSHGLAACVLRHLHGARVASERLGVEVTESALADETYAAHELALLAKAGVAVAIDDFGTGYSSLARLTTLPIHVLKIDQSFVRQLGTEKGRSAVDGIVKLAHALGLRTVAEGIESIDELAALRELGSDCVSGYLLARPSPEDRLLLQCSLDLPTRLPLPRIPMSRRLATSTRRGLR